MRTNGHGLITVAGVRIADAPRWARTRGMYLGVKGSKVQILSARHLSCLEDIEDTSDLRVRGVLVVAGWLVVGGRHLRRRRADQSPGSDVSSGALHGVATPAGTSVVS